MHLQSDRYWKPLAGIVGIPELIDDPRFSTMSARGENTEELVEILDGRFATKTFDEWDRTFRQGGDFIYAKVQSVDELEHDPQVTANDYITTFDHPALGPIKMCNHPIIYSETPAGIWREAPELGQHTEEVLIEELGYNWKDIEGLQEAGAIP
jgi:crotonobetainyl-CoA:carnitine CoA-transferase CaiB-like acyl-CoA transferase